MMLTDDQQTSRLFVKLFSGRQEEEQADDGSANGVICDSQNCRVCIRTASTKTQEPVDSRPKWWKNVVKGASDEWKDVAVENVFSPDVSNRTISSKCLPLLVDAALEGGSTCLATSNSQSEASKVALYGKTCVGEEDQPLLATCISWLFDLIDTFRVTRPSVRFSVRVSASRMFISTSTGETTTTDLLEHITQDGSSGDIPKLLGIGRLSGPRELRASSAKQATAYANAAVQSAASSSHQPAVFIFTLNVYQYQIERQSNGSETISGGRGQFHFVDLSARAASDDAFSSLQDKIVAALSNTLTPSNMPTAFASLTGQTLRDLQRCRLCHFLALFSPHDANCQRVVELVDVFPRTRPVHVAAAKRRQSPELPRKVSQSFDSATLPRLSSLNSFTDAQMSSSITGRLSHCVSGSELSLHTVIHRPSPSQMQASFISQASNGCPPSLASHLSSNISRPSCYSDSETESVSRIRQPCLAPMQPLDFLPASCRASDDDNDEYSNSLSANCSPSKQPNRGPREHHSKSRYARLKRFASSRMKRQIEQQKMWAMMAAQKSTVVDRGGEIWIDGPGAMCHHNKLQQVEDWIDGPVKNLRNNVLANPTFHQQLNHQLNLESQQFSYFSSKNHRSLPRPKRQHPPSQPHYAALLRERQKTAARNGQRPPSISCSSENLFFDSGYFAAEPSRFPSMRGSKVVPGLARPQPTLPLAPVPQQRSTMDPLMENVDFYQRRLKMPQQAYGVTWAGVQDVHYAQESVCNFTPPTPIEAPARPSINFVEAKKVAQSPFMRLKNKLLGKKPVAQQVVVAMATASVPSSPAILAKRQHNLTFPAQQQQQVSNRVSRLTDTSDSGNDCGVGLYVGGVNAPEDALSTTKSLSCSSSASPPSPASAAPSSSTNPGSSKQASSVCSHSSGRGSASSLLSHSVGGSQPSIAESGELFSKVHTSSQHAAWSANTAALSSVEEELASAVSALQQSLGPSPVLVSQKRPSTQKVPNVLAVVPSERPTPRNQRRHVKLDVSEVTESPSRDELLCLESLEQQLRS